MESKKKISYKFAIETIKRQFVQDLLYEYSIEANRLLEYKRILDFRYIPTTVIIFEIDCHIDMDTTQNLRNMIFLLVSNHIYKEGNPVVEIFGEKNVFINKIGKTQFCVLISLEHIQEINKRTNVFRVIDYIRSFIDRQYDAHISVGVSLDYSTNVDLSHALSDAMEAVEYKFFLGENSTIFYKDIIQHEVVDIEDIIKSELMIINNMKQLIIDRKIRSCLFDYLSKIKKNKAMPYKVLKTKLLEILIIYITQLREIGIDQKIIDEYLIMIVKEIELKRTFKDLLFWIKKLFDNSDEKLNILFKDNMYAIVKKAEQYIINNYNQNEISLVVVSEYLNISPFYLSHLFKKVNNLNFNKYLNKIRLENAQKLLIISEKNVSEISDAVGYSDSNYFTKKFKEIYGYPPHAYRKIMQNIHVN